MKKAMIITEQPMSKDKNNIDCFMSEIENCSVCKELINKNKAICLKKNYLLNQYGSKLSDRFTKVMNIICKTLLNDKVDYYWTHYIKHHTNDVPNKKINKLLWEKIGRRCSETWIEREIKEWEPNYILIFGVYPLKAIRNLKSNIPNKTLTELANEKKSYELYFNDKKIKILIFPHPSGKSRLANKYYGKKLVNIEKIENFIKGEINIK
ncbi:hypothetical protein J4427_01365 [Candidatus Woesearchaeota archaeon]|nr:hypothetical protein [Candidatus Woesearchaeota archaeon]